jgi:C1A family cysteine protease
VVVSIYADTTDFVFYNGGVYNPPTCTGEINHSMLLVGYLTPDYSKDPMQLSWKLKNSFGLDWGDNGYMQIIRSDAEPVTGDPGICGIYTNVFFPTAKTTS